MIVTRVVNHEGRAFNVCAVRQGERYGLEGRLVHKGPDPLVEFWDATYERDPRFTPGLGQFVTRYYLSTLKESQSRGLNLALMGHEPAWVVTADNVADAVYAVDALLVAHGVAS